MSKDYENRYNDYKHKYVVSKYFDGTGDRHPTCWYSNNKKFALRTAKAVPLSAGEFVEVWQKDEEGLFGNSGSPLYQRFAKED